MKPLSIKSIVEFKNKTDRSKQNFAEALKLNKQDKEQAAGGDYWISSLSAIGNSFRFSSPIFIKEKIEELEEKLEETEIRITRAMYKRNIDILNNHVDLDPKKWKPVKNLNIEKKQNKDLIMTIKGFQIQTKPSYVFTYQKANTNEVGAIWFVAKLNGFDKEELGMFTDILYRYLKIHYSKDFEINTRYCIAVDLFNKFEVNYSQLEKGEIPFILVKTLDEIKNLM